MFSSPDKNRNVIPRWRSYKRSAGSHEARSGSFRRAKLATVVSDEFEQTCRRWTKEKSVATALDMLGAAEALAIQKNRYVEGAIEFLRTCVTTPPGWDFWKPESPRILTPDIDESVSAVRKYLANNPRNPYLWSDLALHYAKIGKKDKAELAMKVALGLAPLSRVIIRSTARQYVYRDDLPQALWIVRRAENLKYDPWLLSAELALSAALSKPSKYAKYAATLLDTGRIPPIDSSELASAIATLEVRDGKVKRAKRLLKAENFSLPTENALAQVAWTERKSGTKLEDKPHPEVAHTYERDAWKARWDGRWTDSVTQCEAWLEYQPFSSRPAILATYLGCTVMKDATKAVSIAEKALLANPDDFMLRNNLAICYAKSGRAEEAKQCLESVSLNQQSSDLLGIYKATSGLIAYRLGNAQLGRELYKEAKQKHLKTLDEREKASVFQLVEELSFHGVITTIDETLQAVSEKFGHDNESDLGIMLKMALERT